MKKRIFSLLLALCLVAGLLPTTALAEGGTPDPTPISVTVNNRTNGTAVVDAPDQWYKGANRFSVISKLPCVVIVEHSNGADDLLKCGEIDATTGHYRFFINAADGDTISIAVKGDVDLDGIVTNIVPEPVYDGEGVYWGISYTSYKLNANGTRTSEMSPNDDIYNSGDFDVAEISAYISDSENNALNTIKQYAADIDNNGQVTQSDVDFLKNYISGSDTSVSWDIQYNCHTIAFDTGDGGSTVSEQKVLEGEPATEPTAPTKADCTFEGWYNGEAPYDFNAPVIENIILTAKWTVDRIKLTKDILESTYKVTSGLGDYYKLPDGHYYLGENISVDKNIDIGDRSTVNNVILDLNGYELSKDDDTALLLLQNDSTLTVIDSSVTKSGKIVSDYAILFNRGSKLNANGGTIEGDVYISAENAVIDNTDPSNVTIFRNGTIYGDNSSTAINGGVFYSTVNNYHGTITGGTFYGEVTNINLTTGGTFYGEVTNNGVITGGTFYGTVSGGMIEDSAKVTVTFNSDGGSSVDEQKVLSGQKATAPTAPTKAGYSFEGWYNEDTLYDFSTPVTENIILTAKWSVSRIMLTKDILDSNYRRSSYGSYVYSLPSGNYYLGEDISVDKTIFIETSDVPSDVMLNLNGHELKNTNTTNNSTLINIKTDSILTITDTGSGKITKDVGFALYISSNGKLNANGGTIDGRVLISSSANAVDNTDPSNITVFTGAVDNYTIINNGIFYGSVMNTSTINGGIFYGSVMNTNTGTINGGTFYGKASGGTINDNAKVTVTFDTDGGTDEAEQKILKGQKASVPLRKPNKRGYSFSAWYNGDAVFDFANTCIIEDITLTAKWVEKSGITFDTNPQSCTYDGTAQAFSITGTTVTGFDISYKQNGQAVTNPTNAGSYDVIVTRAEDSTYKAVSETISNGLVINPKAVTATISAIPDETYTGSDIEPAITVYDGDTVISASEYTISYSNNKNVGTATVTLADKTGGNYNVSGTTTFEILPKTVTATISAINDETYTGSDIEPTITVYDGDTVIPASEYTVSYSDNRNAGTATVTLTDKTGGNYNVSGTTTFEILPKSIDNAVITRSNTLTYDGTKQTQNISVTLEGFDAVTFDVSGNQQTDVNTNGDYTLTVTGNGNFTGTKNFNWNIAPATPTENSAKKTTARVIKGKALSDATVTNGEILAIDGVTVLDGTFAWVDSTKAMRADGTEQMVFTPDNANYAPITINVAVSTYTTGGGSATPTYPPTVTQPENGTVIVSPKSPKKGDTVTITPRPEAGYTVEQILVTDKSGDPVKVTNNGDGTYSFTQPAGKVDVEATFMEDNSMLNFFVDVFPGDYYYDAVLWAAENGITGGVDDTHFAPNAPCTRAQIVTFLWRAAGCPEPENLSSFADVSADSYYAKAVAWAVENGITGGTGSGMFSPDATCTRAQAMAFIYRSVQTQGGGMQGEWMFLNPFDDVNLESYYGEAVMWAVANGITNGASDTTFSPNNDCTRAQIVTFLFRCLGDE